MAINKDSPQATGLVGSWRLNNLGTLPDETGNSNNGTFTTGTPVLVNGKNGKALSLTAEEIDLGSRSIIKLQSFTYTAWVNTVNTAEAQTIISGSDSGCPQFRINWYGNLALLVRWVGVVGESSGYVPQGTWCHVAVSYDSIGTYKFYINGLLANTPAVNYQTFTPPGSVRLGANAYNAEHFTGKISDVRIYKDILSASRIFNIYANPNDLYSTKRAPLGKSISLPYVGLYDPTVLARGAFDPDLYPLNWSCVDAVIDSPNAQGLTPSLFTNSATFYAPTVAPGAVGLTPSLFTNSATFYAPTVTSGGGTQALTPSLFTNSATFYAHTVAPGAVGLTPSLFTNSATFYAPIAAPGAVGLTPSLFTNSATFYAPTVARGAVGLTPALFTNSATFYAPTVAPGAVGLTPSLFTNSATFYAPTVSSSYALTPSLFTNSATFYAPTVVPGVVGLTPSLFTNSATFYAPTVAPGAVGLTPSLFTNSPAFYAPAVSSSYTLTPALFTNSAAFYAPTLSASDNISPSLFTNAPTFYAPTVTPGPVGLTPPLFTNSTTFYTPTVVPGAINLTPSLFTNSATFYAADVNFSASLTPSLFTNSATFYALTVTPGPVGLTPPLFTNSATFYTPTVVPGAINLTPVLFTNSTTFFSPTIRSPAFSQQELANMADAVWAHPTAQLISTRLLEVWGRLGLDPDSPLITGTSIITFGDIVMAMTNVDGAIRTVRT